MGIDCLVYKTESCDSDNFLERLSECGKSSIVLLYNYRSGVFFEGKMIFKYTPFFLLNLLCVFFILSLFCLKYRPKTLIVENTYDAALIGIFRRLGIVKRMVYICGDWLLNPFFPYFDYLACRNSDFVWDVTEAIKQEREKRWDICREEIVSLYYYKQQPKDNTRKRTKVVFMGQERKDSGLEIARKNRYFKVKTLPFIKRKDFAQEFSDCFCGINLITSENSYTTKTIPSKVIEYLQHNIPVIVTRNCGLIARIVENKCLGIVIKPNLLELEGALLSIYTNQDNYQVNIDRFFKELKLPDLKEVIDGVA